MVEIHCRTNLDLCPYEKWPTMLPEVPRDGDYVESGHEWQTKGYEGCVLRLRVVRVTWKCRHRKYGEKLPNPEWYCEVEMTFPTYFQSLEEFYEWYGRVCGRGKHAFI